MKKTFFLLCSLLITTMLNAEIRVISDVKLGRGYFPKFVNAELVTYLGSTDAVYLDTDIDAELSVDNQDLKLNLYRNGERFELTPHGSDVNYIWASLSPNKQMILFNTRRGTAICDLEGNELINLGHGLDAPVWYGNDYVVGMQDESDGHNYIASSIVIASVDGRMHQNLTNPAEYGMYPATHAESGRIVYATDNGDIRLIQLNLTEQPISKHLPALKKVADGAVLKQMKQAEKLQKQSSAEDYRIYINPGHGGYWSNDRNMAIYPYGNSEQGFWESTSNLDKGLKLNTMLRDLGFQTMMSRTTNKNGGGNDIDILKSKLNAGTITKAEYDDYLANGDDRSLSAIVEEANAYNADFMLSIHSNAGGPSNYILQLFSGITPGDTRSYSHMPKNSEKSRTITTLMAEYQYMNEISCWSHSPQIKGDKTFARDIFNWSNGYGVLRWLNVPGTISEGMMHDYLPETYRLMNMDYKWQEAFYFAKTFYKYFCQKELPYGVIGGKIYDDYREQIFPNYSARKGTRDEFRPINGGVVELWQNDVKLTSYTTDTLYNGCYFFWNLQPGTYVVKALAQEYYTKEDTLVVENGLISYSNLALSAKRATPLEVVEYSPHVELTDSQQVSVSVTLDFNWDAYEDSTTAAFSITPAVDGTVTYENGGRRLRFTPAKRFEPGTEYTVSLSTKACHPDFLLENHLQEPFSFKFRTSMRGALKLIQTYPSDAAQDIPLSPAFIAIFDGELIQSSMNHIKVIGPNGEVYSPNRRNISWNKAPEPYGYVSFAISNTLSPNTEYKLALYPNISDNNEVMLNETIYVSFQTGDDCPPALSLTNSLDTLLFEGDKESSIETSSVSAQVDRNYKYEGLASNKLSYEFSGMEGEAIYVVDAERSIMGNSQSIFAMHIYSDYSFNTLYAKWAVEGDIKYTKICDLDYAGWLYQEADMSALPAGVDYQFMGLRLVRQNSFLSQKGEFYVDALRVKHEPVSTGLESVTENQRTETKFIENGYLHILLNGVKYNVLGAHVE